MISIEKRLPEVGQRCLAMTEQGCIYDVMYDPAWHHDFQVWKGTSVLVDKVTHWMPTPVPDTEDVEKDFRRMCEDFADRHDLKQGNRKRGDSFRFHADFYEV